jgi:prefoldin subunit 5
LLDRKTEYLARKVEKIEEVQKAMQTSHKETAQKLEQILSLLTRVTLDVHNDDNKPVSRQINPPPFDGTIL